MAAEWIATLATAVVGIAGIAGTAFSTRSQRRTQLELLASQQARQDRVEALAHKRTAFIEFLDRYRAVVNAARMVAKASGEDLDDRENLFTAMQEQIAALNVARHRLWLSASLYTVYYADGMLGHATALVQAAVKGQIPEGGVIAAEHKVYHLMRMELDDVDLGARDPEQLALELERELADSLAKGDLFAKQSKVRQQLSD